MTSLLLSHDDYTIAWICALPLEMAAAKAMLDEIHSPLPQLLTDHNTYVLGRLCSHNVAIACLPSGIYGITSAATVLAHMLPTFPSLRFGLMVGIGGGVPGKADIRLGDVVVSKPTATAGGVIQYDLGKTLIGRHFHRTGSLNKPPQVLLTAISQIESNRLTGKQQIQQIIHDALAKNEPMKDQFSRPLDDWLFNPTHNHHNSTDECLSCDLNQLIDRPPRATDKPSIHYGLIASGNQVIKDAQTRDQIAEELDILCFEMEAAGLMDQLPCLVIRGICDYCDSHKHKQWQGYASLTAAAYARELLTAVPVNDQMNHRKAREPLWMVPFLRNTQFTGRQEEITKLENFMSMPNGPRKIALTGLGGVGKTQVALELAYRIQSQDANCSIFWIPSVNNESVEQAYMSIAQHLVLQDISPADVKMQVKTHLSHKAIGKWLLIYDNADDTDMWVSGNDITPALKVFLPQSNYGHIIFTTRNRKLANRLAPSNVILIPEMDERTAREVLQKSLIQKDLYDDPTTTALLQQLTFLPLAIVQASSYINENGIKLSDYLALLQEQEQEIVELLSEDFEDEGRYAELQNPVATTWLVSFHQIQQLDLFAADYLLFMACINPHNIPLSLLPPARSKKKMIDALGLLNAYSFTSTQKDGFLSLHQLVHLATRNWMRNNNLFNLWTCKTADRLDKLFPDANNDNRKLWQEYLPHILFLINGSEFQENKEQYIGLLERVGDCLNSDGRYNEAEEFITQVINDYKQAFGPEHPNTLLSMGNLALTYWNQGRLKEAEELQVQVMETSKHMLGPKHPNTFISMGNLAATYQNQGRWKEAEELLVQVMETCKHVLGPEHPNTLLSMGNLAATYQNQGRWKEAEELGVQVMETHKQVLGPEHPNTLFSMGNLAAAYQNQGRWKEAEELEMQVMETRKQVLGPEHPNTLLSMGNLAATYQNQGRWKEAEELEVQVMETRKQVLGPEHPNTLLSMGNLAATYQNRSRWKEAEELGVQVMETSKHVLGPEHPNTLLSMGNLASTYWNQGRLKEAEELEVQVMETCKQILGPEHPNTLPSMGNLALTYWNQGRLKEAEELLVQVMETCKQVLGPEHPNTLLSIGNLASTYWNQGRLKEAEELEVQVMETCKRILGPEHPKTLLSIGNLASTYLDQGRLKEAEELQVQVMETHKHVLGPEHPDTLDSMINLAHTWKSLGKDKNAVIFMTDCVKLSTHYLGADHAHTITSMTTLSEWQAVDNSSYDESPETLGQIGG